MKEEALEALSRALALSPKLKAMARRDPDLEALADEEAFKLMLED
jgi:hypothetical protein